MYLFLEEGFYRKIFIIHWRHCWEQLPSCRPELPVESMCVGRPARVSMICRSCVKRMVIE